MNSYLNLDNQFLNHDLAFYFMLLNIFKMLFFKGFDAMHVLFQYVKIK